MDTYTKTPAKMKKFHKSRQHIQKLDSLQKLVKSILTLNVCGHNFFLLQRRGNLSQKSLSITVSPFLTIELVQRLSMPFLNVFKDNSGCKVNLKEPTTLLTVSRSSWYVQVTVEEISKILSSLDLYKGLGQENLPTF